jgi:hypothetical protein
MRTQEVNMTDHNINELVARVTLLEQELHRLKAELGLDARPWWEQIAGSHRDDPTYGEFVKELRQQRRADYQAAEKEAKIADKKKNKRSKKVGAR